jgi:hypothetical protein
MAVGFFFYQLATVVHEMGWAAGKDKSLAFYAGA